MLVRIFSVIVDKLFFLFPYICMVDITTARWYSVYFYFQTLGESSFSAPLKLGKTILVLLKELQMECHFWVGAFNCFSFRHFLLLEKHLLIWTGHQTEAAWNSEVISKDNALKVHPGPSACCREVNICCAKPLKGRACL